MDAHELHIQLDPAKRASDDIYEQLRALITSGALKPGDRLPSERAMMAELQRSRPTIREALKRLEQGGYVTSTQGASGAVVQELSLHAEEPLKDMIQLSQVSLSELNEYRQSNDSTIAAWAAKRRTDEDLADLHQCVAEAEAFLDAAVVANLPEVRIVHGYGTGKLRAAVHDMLRRHPRVESFRLGKYGEGEGGVTVVTLK